MDEELAEGLVERGLKYVYMYTNVCGREYGCVEREVDPIIRTIGYIDASEWLFPSILCR